MNGIRRADPPIRKALLDFPDRLIHACRRRDDHEDSDGFKVIPDRVHGICNVEYPVFLVDVLIHRAEISHESRIPIGEP